MTALYGKHLITGAWIGADQTFGNMPVSCAPDVFTVGLPEHVDRVAKAAEAGFFLSYAGQMGRISARHRRRDRGAR